MNVRKTEISMNKHILALLALAAQLTGCSKEPPQSLTPFTGKTTSNSIFLPAAGSRTYDRLTGDGTYGHYWTSTLNETNPYNAYKLNVNLTPLGRATTTAAPACPSAPSTPHPLNNSI